MGVHLRRLRAGDLEEIPHHYEGLPLKRSVLITGWLLGLIGVMGGVSVMVTRAGSWLEVVGAAAATAGALALFGVIRFRRYEIVVGERWIDVGSGPLHHRLGRDGVQVGQPVPAAGWRRLYARLEVPVTAYGGVVKVPTGDPDDLREGCRL